MLVDKSKAARMAGVSRQTIHRKIASGELSATDGQIDTSELIRVFGDIKNPDDVSQDESQPVSRPSQRNSNVQVQLQARIDTLETELAVTREQLRDTATDRDEWREMAKSANENVKLLTDQSGKGSDTNNNVILIAIAALIGVVLLVLGLTGNLGGSAPGSTQEPMQSVMKEPDPDPNRIVVPEEGCSLEESNYHQFYNGCPQYRLRSNLENLIAQNQPLSELETLGWGCIEEIMYWNAETCPAIIGRLLAELEAGGKYDGNGDGNVDQTE